MKLYLVILISVCQMWSVTAVGCNTVPTDVPTFKSCTYRCHCMSGAACDETTGECTNGCAPGWAGPACQYRDATNGYTTIDQAGSSKSDAFAPGMAVDGDISTCSKSTPQPGQFDYWYIELNRQYLINGLSIIVPLDFLESFQTFNINLSLDGENYNSHCYRHSGQHVNNTLIIACINITLARYIKIELEVQDTAIRLCEVSAFSGRELAFNKQTTASSVYYDVDYSPLAVNGKTFTIDEFFSTCFASGLDMTAWWKLDIGRNYLIQDIYYIGRQDCCIDIQMRGFQIQIGNNNYGPWQTIYQDTYTGNDHSLYALRAVELKLVRESSLIRLVRERDAPERFVICEVQIFGECPDGLCGWECTDVCQCSKPPTGFNRIHGTCPTGCRDRYIGENGAQRCDKECAASNWGPSCVNECGNCNTGTCDVTTGTCIGGCSGPWKLPLCNESCDAGWYGINCSQACGQCKDDEACDKTAGTCPNDICEDGWIFGKCKTKCKEGRFGRNCSQQCGQCSGEVACSYQDGQCSTPCKPGFVGHTCHAECPNGHYGLHCSRACGRCIFGLPCNKANGVCEHGCQPGFAGTLCQLNCLRGTYGIQCKDICGNCANETYCHHEDGHCPGGCKAGWQQPLCQTALSEQSTSPSDGGNLAVPLGAASAGIGLIITGVVVFVLIMRRKASSKRNDEGQYETPTGDGMDVSHVYDTL